MITLGREYGTDGFHNLMEVSDELPYEPGAPSDDIILLTFKAFANSGMRVRFTSTRGGEIYDVHQKDIEKANNWYSNLSHTDEYQSLLWAQNPHWIPTEGGEWPELIYQDYLRHTVFPQEIKLRLASTIYRNLGIIPQNQLSSLEKRSPEFSYNPVVKETIDDMFRRLEEENPNFQSYVDSLYKIGELIESKPADIILYGWLLHVIVDQTLVKKEPLTEQNF